MQRLLIFCTCTLAFVVWLLPVRGEAAAPIVDFKAEVWSVLQSACLDCHGPEEQNGGLRFDGLASIFVEADSGEIPVVPGKPDQSELLVRILTDDEDLRMPPDGDGLSESQVKALQRWIAEGAKYPREYAHGETEAEQSHWSFQPIDESVVPRREGDEWSRTDVDRFVDRRLIDKGLTPNPDADGRVLLRRVHYGLTGLPPSRLEVETFVQKVDDVGLDRALEATVDDLLSRPAYGERWGRHWMDWVRYADTAGDNSDFPIPQAYLYRQYIIDSLNADLPYDQFLTEQLAGDLLPAPNLAERNRKVIATGYLAMARRFGSLVERYPWHLTIEDTIDNVGRTMMGLTIACARCHDHKFDPITTREYYGLYGIFESTRYPFPGIELFQVQDDFVPLLEQAEVQQRLGPSANKTEQLKQGLRRALAECEAKALENERMSSKAELSEQRRMKAELDAMLIKARKAGQKLANHIRELPELPTAYAVQDATPIDARVQIKGEPTRPGALVPRGFPAVLGGQRLLNESADSTSGRLQLAEWIVSEQNPLTARVIVNRVWQKHFGRGLVPSTSDFGLRGETPSHPELLDWLAMDFVRHGWSLKHLHRLIMTSRVYRLSSRETDAGLAADPENRWLWKANRKRLDAESIRDSLMLLAGTLDPTPQTQPYPFPSKQNWEFTQHHPFKDEYRSDRRSVYQMTKRLTAATYMQTFDGPDPNVCTSTRDQSITALQALYFVNDAFLHEQADRFVIRLPEASDRDRVCFAFESVLSRPPNETEIDWLLEHVDAVRARSHDAGVSASELDAVAWASLSRGLFRLNEFLYLD